MSTHMRASGLSPQELAEACAAAMWATDQASQGLGMTIDHVGPGEAVLSMTVEERMANGHGICHGGFIFTLADSAFAFACNSYNQLAVAQHCAVTYLRPGKIGERLTAHAKEVSRTGRSGIYDIRIQNGTGETIAEFRGHSRTISGTHLPE
ncbi:phenylacetic acid degradation protein PaaD [Roseibium aquae]|uniref:Phenylacetic acid degradation protein PaaD n=1 Tax=Roseibium aquae TaxID=1323746 RepID=A0A916X1H8_9HYPH|nr:hydroxyphenylacetyl-CoA thioesterase PaaI [Roseibium aquae]GGB53998.1 phenylacetic acid degradation protein PaaD [Roseibium aquae]